MYIDNPKKLIEDMFAIHTMSMYLERIDDFAKDDLDDMISIVYYHKDELWDSNEGGEGSSLWDLAGFEGMRDEKQLRAEMIGDSRKLKRIWRIIQKELGSECLLICRKCGDKYFYTKKPKYTADRYRCPTCKSVGSFEIVPFEEWASPEILYLRKEYLRK